MVSHSDEPIGDRQLEHLPNVLLVTYLSKNLYGRTFEFNGLIDCAIDDVSGRHKIVLQSEKRANYC